MPTGVQVKIKRIDRSAKDLPMPKRMTEHAAGFDLCAGIAQATVIAPSQILIVPCGFAMAIPDGYEAQVRPRSGLASKHGVTVINTPGTIDSDYRGEVKVALINLSQVPFTVERRMRIAQMLVLPVPRVDLVEVDELDETARGAGGFGHTGQ